MTWESSVVVKNRCLRPVRSAARARSRVGRAAALAPRRCGVAAVASGGEHARGRKLADSTSRGRQLRLHMACACHRPRRTAAAADAAAAPCSSSPTAPASPPRPSATRSWRSSRSSRATCAGRSSTRADKAHQVVREINHTAEHEGRQPIVFITLVNTEILRDRQGAAARAWCWTCSAPSSSRSRPSSASRRTTASAASPTSAKSQEYNDRIEAINFALAHDDGQSAQNLGEADVILVGVSRSGKTPTSLYLAMQHGIKAANYPLIPEDFERGQLPSSLAPFKRQVLRPDDRPRAARADPQRAPARTASTRRSRTAATRCARPRR